MRLFVLAAAAALLATPLLATPCLALTVTNAPNRDTVAHLQQQKQTQAPNLPSGFVEGSFGRPQAGLGLSGNGGPTPGVTTFGFGNMRTTVMVDPDAPRLGERRETQAPLSLSAPQRR